MQLPKKRRAAPGHSSQCDTANSVVLAERARKPPPGRAAHLADVPRLETGQNSSEETFLYLKLQNLTRPSDSSAARHRRSWARGTAGPGLASAHARSPTHRSGRAGSAPSSQEDAFSTGRPWQRTGRGSRRLEGSRRCPLLPVPRVEPRGVDQPGGRPGEGAQQRVHPVSAPCQAARLEVQGALCSRSSRQGPLRKRAGGPGPRERVCVRTVWPQVDTELKAGDGDVVGTTCALV